MLGFGYFQAQVRVMGVFRIELDRIRSMVELVDHPTLVKGKIYFLSLFPALPSTL